MSDNRTEEGTPVEGSSEYCEESTTNFHCDHWYAGEKCCCCGASNGATEEK